MSTIAIAGLQLEISAASSNLSKLKERIDHLIETFPWVEMVVVSELAVFGPSIKNAVALPSEVEDELRACAKKHEIWLIPGTLFERSGQSIYNTALVINPSGEVIARYRKMFPFRPYEGEVDAGDSFVLFDVPEVGRFGMSICYDLWFPETARELAARGAEVILHPAMTTTIDRDVELSIARAAAAQNQCFVFDINGLGDGGNGRSIVVGPAGEVRHQAGTAEEMFPMPIDLADVRRARRDGMFGLGQTLKSFRERKVRFSVYGERPGDGAREYLESLGALEKPVRPKRPKK